MFKSVFICAIFAAFVGKSFCDILGNPQSSGAKGFLMCQGKPAQNVKVKLYDDDRGIDADDLMGETTTNDKGYFEVSGYTSEYTTIDPKINIYHKCADGLKLCDRKFTIKIKDNYVTKGKKPSKLYDVGRMELEGGFSGESRDCLN